MRVRLGSKGGVCVTTKLSVKCAKRVKIKIANIINKLQRALGEVEREVYYWDPQNIAYFLRYIE